MSTCCGIFRFLPWILAAVVAGHPVAARGTGPATRHVAGEVLVHPVADVDPATLEALRAEHHGRLERRLLDGSVEVWRVPAGGERELAGRIATAPGVLWAEPNFVYEAFATVPNDPGFSAQWNHARVRSTAAWDVATGSPQITIAIIDSGVDPGHPDLSAKLAAGYDFVDGDADPTDTNGHGTHVAGIAAAATDNGVGVAGMSWGARIMPIRVLDEDGHGTVADIVDAVTWARQHGASVLCLSLGGSDFSQALQNAVTTAHGAGRLVIAAMGNFRGSGNPTNYPAACDHVLAVAGTASDNTYAYYSQYGPHCDLAAPGGEMSYIHDSNGVYSTMPTYACTPTGFGYSLNYDRLQGTSQAAPMVAGAAAILRGMIPSAGPDVVQRILERTAADRGPAGWDPDYGWGLLDASDAVHSVVFGDGFESGGTGGWGGGS